MAEKLIPENEGRVDSPYNIYDNFAVLYDQLKGGPFRDWSIVQNIISLFGYKRDKGVMLDLGCGTGDLLIWLIQQGFNVIGIDSSAGMLNRARMKAAEKGISVTCLNQDIRNFSINQECACIYSRETLAHMLEPMDLQNVFRGCFRHLSHDGLFLFEVATPNELRRLCQGAVIKCPDFTCKINGEFNDSDNKALVKYSFDLKNYALSFEFILKAYTPGELADKLHGIGFKNIKFNDHNPMIRRKNGVPVDLVLAPVSFSTTSLLCSCVK